VEAQCVEQSIKHKQQKEQDEDAQIVHWHDALIADVYQRARARDDSLACRQAVTHMGA
jgi:hypothetical protein